MQASVYADRAPQQRPDLNAELHAVALLYESARLPDLHVQVVRRDGWAQADLIPGRVSASASHKRLLPRPIRLRLVLDHYDTPHDNAPRSHYV